MTHSKKHILFLPRWYPNRLDIQLGTFIQEHARLIADDVQVTVIYVQADFNGGQSSEITDETIEGVREIRVYFKSSTGLFRRLINAKRYKRAQQAGYKMLNQKVDATHVFVPYRSAFLALDLLKENIPFYVTEHWSGHLNGKYQAKNDLDKRMYKKILTKASKISTVSQLLRQKFLANTGFDSIVIPNVIKSVASITNKNSEVIKILSVSDMVDDVKNISGLIIAYDLALLDLREDIKTELTIIGGGPDENAIKDFTSRLDFKEGEIIFAGRKPHEEVLEAMNQCDFYICNSNFETFGMTVAEALRCGKPVISTRCGGPEEFLDKNNSIVVNTQDEENLANAMIDMTDRYKSYNSDEISHQIEQRYGKSVVLQMWKEFYSV